MCDRWFMSLYNIGLLQTTESYKYIIKTPSECIKNHYINTYMLYKRMYIAYNVELMLTSLNNTINYY